MTDNTIARLADEVRSLLGSVLADTSESDLRYQRARADWWVRHRLRVLIEAADRVSKGPTATERDLRFVSELASAMAVIRPLVRLPMWLKIVHALTYEYNHAVIALHFAAAFESQGMRATLVDSAAHPTPDIEFAVPDGHFPFFVEVYQPPALDGRTKDIDPQLAGKCISRALSKAKAQLGAHRIGIVAIGGFGLSIDSMSILEAAANSQTTRVDMPSFAGIAVGTISSSVTQTAQGTTAQPVLQVRYALNQRYFSAISIETDVGNAPARLATEKQVLREITADQAVGLPIVHGSGSKVPPLFLGAGPVDLACASCGAILAHGVWAHSFSQVAVECPKCRKYALLDGPEAPMAQRVALTPGHFNFSDHADVRQGIVLEKGLTGQAVVHSATAFDTQRRTTNR